MNKPETIETKVEQPKKEAIVFSSAAYVFEKPDSKSKIIDTLFRGQEIKIFSSEKGYSKIEKGYVLTKALKTE